MNSPVARMVVLTQIAFGFPDNKDILLSFFIAISETAVSETAVSLLQKRCKFPIKQAIDTDYARGLTISTQVLFAFA